MKKFLDDFFAQSFGTKLFTVIGLALFMLVTTCNAVHAEVRREGKTFIQVTTREKAEPTATGYTYTDTKGNSYPIFLSANGRAYINRVSGKTGKEYKYYLTEDIARQICSELGVEYKETTKKSK